MFFSHICLASALFNSWVHGQDHSDLALAGTGLTTNHLSEALTTSNLDSPPESTPSSDNTDPYWERQELVRHEKRRVRSTGRADIGSLIDFYFGNSSAFHTTRGHVETVVLGNSDIFDLVERYSAMYYNTPDRKPLLEHFASEISEILCFPPAGCGAPDLPGSILEKITHLAHTILGETVVQCWSGELYEIDQFKEVQDVWRSYGEFLHEARVRTTSIVKNEVYWNWYLAQEGIGAQISALPFDIAQSLPFNNSAVHIPQWVHEEFKTLTDKIYFGWESDYYRHENRHVGPDTPDYFYGELRKNPDIKMLFDRHKRAFEEEREKLITDFEQHTARAVYTARINEAIHFAIRQHPPFVDSLPPLLKEKIEFLAEYVLHDIYSSDDPESHCTYFALPVVTGVVELVLNPEIHRLVEWYDDMVFEFRYSKQEWREKFVESVAEILYRNRRWVEVVYPNLEWPVMQSGVVGEPVERRKS